MERTAEQNEKRLENRKRCLACKYYGRNSCPLLVDGDVFSIDKCILDHEGFKNIQEGSPAAFMLSQSPIIFLRYLNYCRRDKLPEVGTKVITLRPGFSGPAGVIRYIREINQKYIELSDEIDNHRSISEIETWYNDFFEI